MGPYSSGLPYPLSLTPIPGWTLKARVLVSFKGCLGSGTRGSSWLIGLKWSNKGISVCGLWNSENCVVKPVHLLLETDSVKIFRCFRLLGAL